MGDHDDDVLLHGNPSKGSRFGGKWRGVAAEVMKEGLAELSWIES